MAKVCASENIARSFCLLRAFKVEVATSVATPVIYTCRGRAAHNCGTTRLLATTSDELLVHHVLQAGSSLPPVVVKEGTPGTDVKITDLFKGKKGILFGVPGAFTPVCSSVSVDVFA